jgi:Domain of unknown function (DUF6916)
VEGPDIRERYVRLINERLCTPDGTQLQVVEVTKPQFSGEFQAFSVFLRGPLEAPLEQGMVDLREASGARDPLFLVPVGRDSRGVTYEACFNVRANVATW